MPDQTFSNQTVLAAPEMQMGLSIRSKLAIAIAGLLVLSLGLLAAFILDRARQALLEETTHRGVIITRNLASYSSSALLTHDTLGLASNVNAAMKNEAMVYAFLADDKGVVQASNDISHIGQAAPPLEGDAPELANLPPDVTILVSIDEKSGRDILTFTSPITKSGIKVGTAYTALSQSAIQKVVRSVTTEVAVLVALFLVLGVMASWILARLILRPVGRMTAGALAIGAGNLDTRIEVHSHDELGLLAASFNHMTKNLKDAQEEVLEKQRLQQELSIAQEIQKALLPKATPQLPGYQIASFYQPAKEVGGDYFDFIQLSPSRLAFTVADVSGKGVPGSLGMTMARSVLRSQAFTNTLPAETLTRTNAVIQPDIRKGMFVTMFYCVLDTTAHQILCANAGHNPAIHIQAGRGVEAVGPEGMALGLAPASMYFVEDHSLALDPGDLFVLYTDGVTEAMNTSGEEYGEQRFIDSLLRWCNEDFSKLSERILADIGAFTKGAPQHDDITLVVVRRAAS